MTKFWATAFGLLYLWGGILTIEFFTRLDECRGRRPIGGASVVVAALWPVSMTAGLGAFDQCAKRK